MFVGDSVTYGTTFVGQDSIFTSLLQRDLPRLLGRPVEVLNASAGGWAPGNEVGYLRSRGTFGSSLVVFVLNTGDLDQPFNGGTLSLVSGYPARKPPLALWEAWVRYLEPRLLRHSTADAGSVATKAPAETSDSAGVIDALSSALAICARHNARFSIVYVPSHGAGWDTPAYAERLANLNKWAAEHGIPFLNTSDELAGLPLYVAYFDGVHLRPAGDAKVARCIEENWHMLGDVGR